jgi:hypothetical protein
MLLAGVALADGSKDLSNAELSVAGRNDPRASATGRHQAAVRCLGNLTLLGSAPNSAQRNFGWRETRPELMKHSLLAINQPLAAMESWDEEVISERAEALSRAQF